MGIVNEIKDLLMEAPLSLVLKERLNATLEKASQLEGKVTFLTEKVERLVVKNASLTAKAERLITRNEALTAKVRVLTEEKAALKSQVIKSQICNKQQIKEIGNLKHSIAETRSFDICPYCRKPEGRLLRIEPHPTFGEVGLKAGYYKCSHCNKQYDKEIQPK